MGTAPHTRTARHAARHAHAARDAVPAGRAVGTPPEVDLRGAWRLADERGEHDLILDLPGDVHGALREAGVIADPYVGLGEGAARWVSERGWTLARAFELDAVPDAATLVLDRVDCHAEVRVNGTAVLSPRNAFRPWSASLAGLLREGSNEIAIDLLSPVAEGARLQAAQPYPVPHLARNCPIPNGNMLRKPQCDFGWDWAPALAPMGVYGRVAILGPAGEIAAPAITQDHEAGRVTVRIQGEVTGRLAPGPEAEEVVATLLSPDGEPVARAAGPLVDGGYALALSVEDPALWWPLGHGAQPLHTLELAIGRGAGAIGRRTGLALREVALVSEPDGAGRSFLLRVNGRDVFCRGASWVPPNALPGDDDPARTRDLLASAAAASMTMIRVWGGGRYEPDEFYAACDALGLLVWQDAMLSCNLYPATPAFLGEIDAEIAHQARRLSHRVALWCGDNELVGALGWFEESVRDRDRYLVAYDRLNRTIEAALHRALPGANWWPSSPSKGPLDFGDAWHEDGAGDMHYWTVWHENAPFARYREVRPRFCSEFGFQSFPSLPEVARFADPAERNVSSRVMDAHQKDAGGNERIAATMMRSHRFPHDFGRFVWLSQVQQAEALRTAVEWWRSLKPHCMGTLIWQLNDTWPCASWSLLDHSGGWKVAQHAARRFFRPVHAFLLPDAGGVRVHAVNDTGAPVTVEAHVRVHAAEGGLVREGRTGGRVPMDRAVALEGTTDLAHGEVAMLEWTASDGARGHGHHVLDGDYKSRPAEPPEIALRTERDGSAWRVELAADRTALFVTLEADRPGRFSDNALAIEPGRTRAVRFDPHDLGDDAPSLRVSAAL